MRLPYTSLVHLLVGSAGFTGSVLAMQASAPAHSSTPDLSVPFVQLGTGGADAASDASVTSGPGTSGFTLNMARWPDSNGNTFASGEPIQLTWSFVEDGNGGSTLFQTLDAAYPGPGGRQQWIGKFQAAFDRWEELSGVDFERVVFEEEWDDSTLWFGANEQPGRAGHIRIRMAHVANGLALANPPFGSAAGDITLSSAATYPLSFPGYFNVFDNTLMYSIGYALGLKSTCPNDGTKLMEPGVRPFVQMWGPQHDDVRGIQRLYGDPLEPNNDLANARAIDLGLFANMYDHSAIPLPPVTGTYGPTAATGRLSIDSYSDVDYFKVQWDEPIQLRLFLDNIGLSYPDEEDCLPANVGNLTDSLNVASLEMDILDRTGAVLVTGSSTTGDLLIHTGVPYYIRVRPVAGSLFYSPQSYQLRMTVTHWNDCTSNTGCDDLNPANGVETCSGGNCIVTYVADCNGNYIEDQWDILQQTSQDWDMNGVPDECQEDCNGNGILDLADIVNGTSLDNNSNGIPDECEDDCNQNGIPDTAELSDATDMNGNGVLDVCETTRYVPVNSAYPNTSYPTIDDALQACNNGDTIQLASGVFTGQGNRNLLIQGLTVQIRGSASNRTIIDLQGQGRFALIAPAGGNHPVTISDLRIRNGNVTGLTNAPSNRGGAIWIRGTRVTIDRCIFDRNFALNSGGAIHLEGDTTGFLARNSVFFSNFSGAGAGIGILNYSLNRVYNCTFSGNWASSRGSAITSFDTVDLNSCIIHGNVDAIGEQLDITNPEQAIVQYCVLPLHELQIYEALGQDGNLHFDPQFVDSRREDFRLSAPSMCRNMGDPSVHSGGNPLDFDRTKRVVGGRVDIGADELR